MELDLNWVPRLQNTEADELSNQCWTRFDLTRRVDFQPKDLESKFLVLPMLLKYGEPLFLEIQAAKRERGKAPALLRPRKRKRPEDRLAAKDPW